MALSGGLPQLSLLFTALAKCHSALTDHALTKTSSLTNNINDDGITTNQPSALSTSPSLVLNTRGGGGGGGGEEGGGGRGGVVGGGEGGGEGGRVVEIVGVVVGVGVGVGVVVGVVVVI